MTIVSASELPSAALLRKYAPPAGYADCYVTEVAFTVSHEAFVSAFYATPLFRLERAILGWFASRPSTDEDVNALAAGSSDRFAAWRVEARADNQILLADFTGGTRSWLMVCTRPGAQGPTTLLYFGSAVLLKANRRTGHQTMGLAFKALLGFHKLYSRALVRAARGRLVNGLSRRKQSTKR